MRLKKYRGQHLLTDKNMLRKIVDTARISPEDNVIEIGAGTGLLTSLLVLYAKRVVSIEIDKDFEEKLRALESEHTNLAIYIQDFLEWNLQSFLRDNLGKWKIVANIPYNITSPIIEKILREGEGRLSNAQLLVQKEMAKRMVATPGTKEYGRLSVFVQYFCDTEILFDVPPTVFVPPPKVESAVLSMKFREIPFTPDEREFQTFLFHLVAIAFSQRRKQLGKLLKLAFPHIPYDELLGIMKEIEINSSRRGETLSVEEFIMLARGIFSRKGKGK